jgi:hypothetical protein
VRRWDCLTERQLAVLTRIAAGEDLSSPKCGHLRRSANALRDRDLITIRRRGGWRAEITDAGNFYLAHGHHPADPRQAAPATRSALTARRKRASRTSQNARTHRPPAPPPPAHRHRDAALALLEGLQEGPSRSQVIKRPTDDEVTRWRQVVAYARRQNLIPDGCFITTQRVGNKDNDLWIRLRTGQNPASGHLNPYTLPPVPVPTELRLPHSVVADLRDDHRRLAMRPESRQRCLRYLQGLALEAEQRGYRIAESPVPDRYKVYYEPVTRDGPFYYRNSGELELIIDGFSHTVSIHEAAPYSSDPAKRDQLVVELLSPRPDGRQYRWADRTRHVLEDTLAALLFEAETRSAEQRRRHEEQERARAEEQRRWEQAMAVARQKATQAYYTAALDEQLRQWQRAKQLRTFSAELQARVDVLESEGEDVSGTLAWLAWIAEHVTASDPAVTLPTMPEPPTLEAADLHPYLKQPHPRRGHPLLERGSRDRG